MNRPLEGLCTTASLATEQADRKFPVRGGHMCLVTGFVIGLPVCLQRQEQDRAEPSRGLCERGACHHYIAKPDAKPSRLAIAREKDMPKTEERKHIYDPRPIPKGAIITRAGTVYLHATRIEPCPGCKTGWKLLKVGLCNACRPKETPAERAA